MAGGLRGVTSFKKPQQSHSFSVVFFHQKTCFFSNNKKPAQSLFFFETQGKTGKKAWRV